jgi:hypothetical protein
MRIIPGVEEKFPLFFEFSLIFGSTFKVQIGSNIENFSNKILKMREVPFHTWKLTR